MIPGSPEHIEHLGSENATSAERIGAVTNCGQCLICREEWALTGDGLGCPHDEIQVIAMLRGQLARAEAETARAEAVRMVLRGDSNHTLKEGDREWSPAYADAVALAQKAAQLMAAGNDLVQEHLLDCKAIAGKENCPLAKAWRAGASAEAPAAVATIATPTAPAPGPRNMYPWLADIGASAIVVVFAQDPDGRWSATASGAATGSVSGTATKAKALHALAYVLELDAGERAP